MHLIPVDRNQRTTSRRLNLKITSTSDASGARTESHSITSQNFGSNLSSVLSYPQLEKLFLVFILFLRTKKSINFNNLKRIGATDLRFHVYTFTVNCYRFAVIYPQAFSCYRFAVTACQVIDYCCILQQKAYYIHIN